MSNTATTSTAPINSVFNNELAAYGIDALETDAGFVIRFTDADQCIEAINKAKIAAVASYLKGGGNPRNKRAIGTQYAAMKRAVIKATA
jgi:hypothetical protein